MQGTLVYTVNHNGLSLQVTRYIAQWDMWLLLSNLVFN